MQKRSRQPGESRVNPKYASTKKKTPSFPPPSGGVGGGDRIKGGSLGSLDHRAIAQGLHVKFLALNGPHWMRRLEHVRLLAPDIDWDVPAQPKREHTEATVPVVSYQYKSLAQKGNRTILKRAWRDVGMDAYEKLEHLHYYGDLDWVAVGVWYATWIERLRPDGSDGRSAFIRDIISVEQAVGRPSAQRVAYAYGERQARVVSKPTTGHGKRRVIPVQLKAPFLKKWNIDGAASRLDEVFHDPDIS